MSWIYKRYIALKITEIIIPTLFSCIGINTEKVKNELIDGNNINFEINDKDKIKIIEFVENCIERVKPLSKSNPKGNKKRKISNGKELQKHDSQLSILMPRLSKELIQWYFQKLITLNHISSTSNIKIFKFEKNLEEWCKELKEKFPVNKYIQSVIASGIFLNFILSKAEFLKLQLYTIPFILSKSEKFMLEQKKIIDVNTKKLNTSEKSNKEKNIALYLSPVKLNNILSSSSTHNVNRATELMSNHVKSLILSNFISKLYLSNNDVINYLKPNTNKPNKNEFVNSIFMIRYIEDCNTLAKLIYMNEKNNCKLSKIIKNNDYNTENEQDIINEIYHMITIIDEKLKQTDNSNIRKEIDDIENVLENESYFNFNESPINTEDRNKIIEDRKLIIKAVRSVLSNRYLNGVKRFLNILNNNDDNKSLEIYNELSCNHSKDSIFGDFDSINNSNLKNINRENLILYWILWLMYEQKILKKEDGQAVVLNTSENDSLIVKGKQIIQFIKESMENIYIDLECIDFSNNKTQKYIPIIKNIKQGRIYLKNITKDLNSDDDKVSTNERISEIYLDLNLIISRVFNINQQKPINKVIFVNNVNKEHHYMQLIALLEWIQYYCKNYEKLSHVSGDEVLELKKYNKIIKIFVEIEWEIITHGKVDNLWDLSMLDSLKLTSNKTPLDLNFLIDASKIEMSEVIESNIEKYRDMENELQEKKYNKNEEFKSVENVNEIIEISGISSIILQNLQYRRMKNYKYEWEMSSSNNDNDDFDDFDDFSNNKKTNIGLYLQYIYAKICSILRNCDFNKKQQRFLNLFEEKKQNQEDSLFSKNTDIFENIEKEIKNYINDKLDSIFDFEELVRVTPEVFPFIWFLDDYLYNIYPSVYQKIEPSLILDALNHISHSISSASSNLRVKGLGKSNLSNEIKAMTGRKRTRNNELESNDIIENNDQYWETLANTRLMLFSYVRKILYHGLSVLGVQPLDRM